MIDVKRPHLVVIAGFSSLNCLLGVDLVFFFYLTFYAFNYLIFVFLELGSTSAVLRGCPDLFQLLEVFDNLSVRMIVSLFCGLRA